MNETSPPRPPARPSGTVGCLIGGLTLLLAVGSCVFVGVKTRGCGLFTITSRAYYRVIVAHIVAEPRFQKELGKPIVVDDDGVYCDAIRGTPVGEEASCEIPVRGRRASGSVHVRVQNGPTRLSAALRLEVGDKVIDAQM